MPNTDTIMDPIHPGEILAEDYLTPLGITQHKLAIAISVPPRRINEIVHGTRRITPTLHSASPATSTTERFWLNLQNRYDIESQRTQILDTLKSIVPLKTA